jgi:exopolyphosphatase/pppGpp-phosphohydrolase
MVLQAGATKYAAVATAVYRTSENGAKFISDLAQDVGVRIQVVDLGLSKET